MRTTHETRHSKLGWISAFFAASTSEFGCDDNGCDTVPRVNDDMRSWVSILEEDHGYAVTIVSERKSVMVDALERDDVDGFKQCTLNMFRHLQEVTLPNANRRILVINIGCVDRMGHVSGFGGFNYFAQVDCLDRQIALLTERFWEQRPTTSTFVLMVNHGGDGYDHNSFTGSTVQVPFAAWGYGFKKNSAFWTRASEIEQIGPTLFTAFGYQDCMPPTWLYHPIENIYDNETFAVYDDLAATPLDFDDVSRQECVISQSVDHSAARRTADIYQFVFLSVSIVLSVVAKRYI